MKKTQFIELFSNIKATLVSFLSIVLFVALGVGLYSGLCWSAKALQGQTNNALKDANMHDVEVNFPYGITPDDIDAVSSLDGVSGVEAGYVSYQGVDMSEGVKNAIVRSVTSGIDCVTVDEGTLPASVGEAAIDSMFAYDYNVHIGDTLSLVHDAQSTASESGMRYLKTDKVTVTALVTSPAYLSKNRASYGTNSSGDSIECVMFVPEEAFDFSELGGYYNTLLVASDALDGLSVYSDEYKAKATQLVERIQSEGSVRAQTRFNDFIGAKQKQVDKARARLQKFQAKAENGVERVMNAQKKIDAKTREVEDAQLELNVTSKLLDSQEQMTRSQLDQIETQITKFEGAYATARAVVDDRVAQVKNLKKERKGVDAYVASLNKSFNTLDSSYKDITSRFESNEISQEERDNLVVRACDVFSADVKAASKRFKKTSPTIYKRSKAAVDAIDVASEKIVTVQAEEMSTALQLADGIIGQAEAISQSGSFLENEATSAASDATTQMNSFKDALADVRSSYDKQKAHLDSVISDSRTRILNGRSQVADGTARLVEAQKKVDSKTDDLLAAQTKLDDGKKQLEEAQSQIDDTVTMGWICMPAHYNGGVIFSNGITDVLKNLRASMASLFVIVGLLVCYSAVSRIVHEQVRQLGTKKALGFTNSEVTLFYLSYSAAAVILGAVCGIAIAMLVVEPILIPSINQTVLGGMPPVFAIGDFAVVSAIELVLILLSTYIACRGVLKRSAIELLQGEKPPQNKKRFYEKWNIWSRLPLLTQTVVNNCVNDRRRIISTLVGVAGCTALIVSAVTLKDNVGESFIVQENDICTYNAFVYTNNGDDASQDDYLVADLLQDKGLVNSQVMRSTLSLACPDGDQRVASLYVPQDQASFAQLFRLHSLNSGKGTGALDGVWVTSAYANSFHAKEGDTVKLKNSLGQQFEVPIVGFFEYYSSGIPMVMSAGAYEHFMGVEPEYSGYIVDTGDETLAEFTDELWQASDFRSVSDEARYTRYLSSIFEQLSNTVVAIYIGLSALMAVIVLLNLNTMFINEKKRELIVLMINGYSVRDAKRYIYRDSIVMAVVGILLGCLLGIAMGYITVCSAEGPTMAVMKFASWKACLMGGVLAAVFTAAMTAIALKRIPRFQLTDINK